MNAKLSHQSSEHATPPEIIEPMREVLGGIDLDPCTSQLVNAEIVKAERCYTLTDNGFRQEFRGTTWLNPPGGYCDAYGIPCPRDLLGRQVRTAGAVSSPRAWFERLVKHHQAGLVPAFGYEAFSIEQLATLQKIQEPYRKITDFAVCILRERVRHLRLNPDGELVRGNAPTHASAIVYAGPNLRKFKRLFSKLGATGVLR